MSVDVSWLNFPSVISLKISITISCTRDNTTRRSQMSLFTSFRIFRQLIALTQQPGGVVLFSSDDAAAAEAAEEGRVAAHEV